MTLRVISTEEWQANPRDPGPMLRPAGIAVYSARTHNRDLLATPAAEEKWACTLARKLQRRDIESGAGDSAHHLLVTIAGVIVEGRQGTLYAAERGCVVTALHNTDRPQATDFWGILLEGDYCEVEPGLAQWVTLRQLCAHLCLPSHLDSRAIYPRAVAAADLRDTALHEALPRLREEVRVAKFSLLFPELRRRGRLAGM